MSNNVAASSSSANNNNIKKKARPQPKRNEVPLIPIHDFPKPKYRSTKGTEDSDRFPEFLCKLKFKNDIPSLPCEPKFLQYPMDPSRFTRYTTALDSTYKYSLHTEPDLGIPINLIEPDAYEIIEEAVLAPEDEALLQDDDLAPTKQPTKEPTFIPWLRKTTYLSADYSDEPLGNTSASVRRVRRTVEAETEEDGPTAEEWGRQIEKEFEEAQEVPVHPTNASLQPVSIMPVLPNEHLWPNTYAHIVFDEDPASGHQVNRHPEKGILQLAEKIGSTQHVSYFLPSPDEDEEDGEAEAYQWVRQYTLVPRHTEGHHLTCFFQENDQGQMTYGYLNTRTHLRRIHSSDRKDMSKPSTRYLRVKYFPVDDEELQQGREELRKRKHPEYSDE